MAFGQATAFVPASVSRRYERPDVAYVPVSDLSPMVLSVAWPQASRSRAVAAFVTAALAARPTVGAALPGGESVETPRVDGFTTDPETGVFTSGDIVAAPALWWARVKVDESADEG